MGTVALIDKDGLGARANYIDRIKPTGRVAVDALLAGGRHWFHQAGGDGSTPAAVARRTLTYSFISSTTGLSSADAKGFRALNGAQQQRVRDALATYASVIDVSFSEVDSGGDVQYSANTQAGSAGYARYPGDGSQVMLAANQGNFQGEWGASSYEWQVLLHETGHALGLKHPGNYNAGGGGTPGPYLPAGSDNRSNSLMSYRDAGNMQRITRNGNSFSRETVNADSLQSLDIAALQYLYGAAQGTPARTYSFDTNPVFSRTIWNPNPGSAIDLSNQSADSVIDLRAGRKSSIARRDPYADTGLSQADYAAQASGGRKLKVALGVPTYSGAGNLSIAEGSRFTAATGGSGNDSLVAPTEGAQLAGNAGNDRFFWTGGNLTVDGGDGNDTLLVKKVRGATWRLSEDKSTLALTRTVAKTGESTTLGSIAISGIEAVRLWDGKQLAGIGKALYVIA